MKQLFLVGLGGFLGAIFRFQMGVWLTGWLGSRFPWGTLAVNLAGCFLIGVMVGWGEKRGVLSAEMRGLFISGFLGGFTTFSAFGLETVTLLRQNRMAVAAMYVAVSVLGGLGLVWLGMKWARSG